MHAVVVLFLIAINAVFAGAIWALGGACQRLIAECMTLPGVPLLIGIAALAIALWFARRVISAGSKRRR